MMKYLDARFLGHREEAHDYLQEQFDLPDYYGRNLDALYDCLSEEDDLEIVITHADDLSSEEEISCYEKFLDVLCETCNVTILDSSVDE